MLFLTIVFAVAAPHARAETLPLPTLDQAIERFAIDQKASCDFEQSDISDRPGQSQVYDFTVKSPYGGADVAYRLFEIPCSHGAYNLNTVYYVADGFSGLRLVTFAEPVLGAKDEVTGWSTTDELTNAGFDPKTLRLDFFAKGRGLADCFNAGSYAFDGQFVLKRYEVDSKCDGKVNPKTIVDFK